MDTCSTSLIIRELQIKTTMKYHLTPVTMTIVKKLQTMNEGKDVKWTLLHDWWDINWSLWRTVWRFFNKLGIKLPRESQVLVAQLCPALCSFVWLSVAPWTVAHKPPLSKEFYRKEWSPAQVGCMRQVLGPGALGRPRGIGWRGRWEGGSGWGTHVNPWLIHFNVWQNPLQ